MQELGVFAKHWRPGTVKTRLAVDLGTEVAAQLHRAFLVATLRRLDRVADRRWLVFSPADAGEPFHDVALDHWRLEPQSTGDLGRRLDHFMVQHATSPDDKLVALGADSPNLPLDRITAAFDCLHNRKAVLGPTADGGYYLIGARGKVRPILEGVDWDQGNVLDQTIACFDEAAWSYALLPPWYDVDVLSDLDRLRDDLEQVPHADLHLDALNSAIRDIVSLG